MKIFAKIKFGASEDKIEGFGNNRFLVYMKYQKDNPDAFSFFIYMISKRTGSDPKNIKYLGKQGSGNFEEHVFEV